MKFFQAAFFAFSLSIGMTSGASGSTVTIQNVGGTIVYGSISYTGASSDILGWYNGAWVENLAERFAAGNNASESSLVGNIIGNPTLNLGSTELPLVGQSTTVPQNTYFTAKFGQSLAIFHNTSDGALSVTFSKDDNCKDFAASNADCGGISHFKHVGDGTPTGDDVTTPVPLPAAGWMLLAGLGLLGAMRRRHRA